MRSLCCICFGNGAQAVVRPSPTTPIRVLVVLRAFWGGPFAHRVPVRALPATALPCPAAVQRRGCVRHADRTIRTDSGPLRRPPPLRRARPARQPLSPGPAEPNGGLGCLPSPERGGGRRGRRAATPKQSGEPPLFPQTNTQRYITTNRLPRSGFIFPASSELRDEPARR